MNLLILVDRLKELRRRSGKSQEWVSRRARINRRHLQRMEGCTEEAVGVRLRTVQGLAKAYNVEPEVLTGERDLPFDSSAGGQPEESRAVRQTTVRLDARSTLNYDLIERRYGVNLQEVVNIAPLLFVIHAEQSARRRKQLNKERLASVEQVMQLSEAFPKLKSLIGHPDVDDWFEDSDEYLAELSSIEANDIFGQRVWDEFPGDGSPNPFVTHLDAVLGEMDAPLLASISRFEGIPFDAVVYFPGNRVPEHEVCRSDLLEITGSDFEAIMALRFGVVRVRDIPEELMGNDKLVERVTWLRAVLRERSSSAGLSPTGTGSSDIGGAHQENFHD